MRLQSDKEKIQVTLNKTEDKEMNEKKMDRITADMISDFEGNNRGKCLFCGVGSIGLLDIDRFDYRKIDVPKGFTAAVFQCQECLRCWVEITRFEEVQR